MGGDFTLLLLNSVSNYYGFNESQRLSNKSKITVTLRKTFDWKRMTLHGTTRKVKT
jgi:hypothetical protein